MQVGICHKDVAGTVYSSGYIGKGVGLAAGRNLRVCVSEARRLRREVRGESKHQKSARQGG